MNVKKIVFTSACNAEYIDDKVRDMGDCDVLVKTVCTTISCGTERANLIGHKNVSGNHEYDPSVPMFPRYTGYSESGIVEKVGKNVTSVKVGDRVACSWGHHSTYNVLDEKNVTPLPENISFSVGAICHIATFPLAGVRKTNLEIGESAMTVGLGILGMLSLMFMKLAGAYPVIAVDPNPERRRLALTYGADYAFDPESESFVDDVRRVTNGRMVNAAVEVTGNGKALERTLDVMARFGRVSLLGCTRDSDFTIDYYKKIHCPGITLVGAHTNARPSCESHDSWWSEKDDREAIIRLLEAKRIDFSEMVCETHKPWECTEVYRRLANDRNFPFCVQFDWSEE